MTMTMTIAMITRMATITHMATTAMTMTMTTTTINMFTPRTAAARRRRPADRRDSRRLDAAGRSRPVAGAPAHRPDGLPDGRNPDPQEARRPGRRARAGLQPDAARADRGSRRRRAGPHHGRHQVAGHDARAAGRERAAPARARRQARELVGHRRRRPDGRAVRVLAFRRLVRLRHRRAGRGRHPGLRPGHLPRAGSPCATAISTSTP